MTALIGFIIGLMLGGTLGIVGMALLRINPPTLTDEVEHGSPDRR